MVERALVGVESHGSVVIRGQHSGHAGQFFQPHRPQRAFVTQGILGGQETEVAVGSSSGGGVLGVNIIEEELVFANRFK